MVERKPRRNFLGLLGASLSGAAVVVLGRAAPARGAIEDAKKGEAFSGTSKTGDLKEALEAAIQAALDSTKVVDAQAAWTIKEVSGIKGGIAGRNEITVTIDAVVP